MHRAKHRASGESAVLATALLERFADVPGPRSESTVARHGVATLPARATTTGHALFGAAPRTAPMLAVQADEVPADAAALFREDGEGDTSCERTDAGSPFGAARHARGRGPVVPAPRVPTPPAGTPVTRPVSTALSLTVFGAAAAVTAVVAPPPTAVETTGSLAPVQSPAPAPVAGPVATLPAAPALAALPDEPTMQVDNLVTQVTGEMAKVDRPYTTVANTERLSSPAAMRKAAMTNALAKLGTPYRWGAMGPNAFDCSGLVKWSFANAGKSLPRTSRAMAGVGVPVSKSQLQPGDLVFFYKPISHVGIYIGNGKIVHASRKGQPVKISDMSKMRFSGARRVV